MEPDGTADDESFSIAVAFPSSNDSPIVRTVFDARAKANALPNVVPNASANGVPISFPE